MQCDVTGAWHNIALSVACVLLIWTLPFLLSPLYSTGLGVLITHVPEVDTTKTDANPTCL